MKYDFDSVINRRETDSLKWHIGENELPMWVADMDFQAAPEILEGIRERLDHGIFGYPVITDKWYDAYGSWWSERHGFYMKKEALIFCAGVIPAVSSLVRAFTEPGANVLIQPPVYNAFFGIIRGNGRAVQENPLIYRDGVYKMDFDDLERKMSDPKTKLMILCNPHNPTGNIWSREDLKTVGELAKKLGVTVISDEIHCDLTEPGRGYIPFASASDVCADVGISCIAPTKAFNLAGLKTSAVYVSNPELREAVKKAFAVDELSEPNAFAEVAAVTAFERGGEWLDELRRVVSQNRKRTEDFLQEELPQIKAVRGEATYLVWLDLTGLKGDASGFGAFLRSRTGLFLSPGKIFGEQGSCFLRMNIACPQKILKDGLSRLKAGAGEWNKTEAEIR
ncbi:MAG: pyridoxal phosphate-dependent aminotransferase [Lachnospiraceae bacterium]|nr:pyridoxal phosphate-dependent aminotransferase [Lachnospiraceae bacterium]